MAQNLAVWDRVAPWLEGLGDEPPLQRSRRADADQLAHKQAEIEAASMNQQALSYVGVAAEVHATHSAGLIEMGEGSFQALAAQAQQTQASRTPDAPTIAVHRVARGRVLLPVPSSPIGFGDVTADAHRFEIDERLIAVIARVADDFFDARTVGPHGLHMLGGFNRVSILVVASPSSAS